MHGTENNLSLTLLAKELKSIPKPFFISGLFPEEDIAICRPLSPPFDNFAITHFGTVFLSRPLHTHYIQDVLTLNIASYCIPKTSPRSFRQLVCLQNRNLNIRKTFFVDRLLLDRFYGVKLTDSVDVEYGDGDEQNVNIYNVAAHYKSPRYEKVPDEERDLHEYFPLH